MKLQAFMGSVAALAVALVVVGSGCSSAGTNTVIPAPPVKCDSAKCSPGNECIEEKGETKCRLVCLSQRATQGCPTNFNCVAPEVGKSDKFYCSPGVKQLVKNPAKGQWGTTCNPSGGKDTNPDCDAAEKFACFGISPLDGQAYCTRYGCADDTDCPAEFVCQDTNEKPNVTDKNRSAIGATVKVCKKREFCASCKYDIDCPTDTAGRTQACLDVNGEKFCAPSCQRDTQCPNEGRCGESGYCRHASGSCKISGEFCSRCVSDKDCKNGGACVQDEYSTEKFCTVVSASNCVQGQPPPADCPKTGGDGHQVYCVSTAGSPVKNHCVATFQLGSNLGPWGCYTPNRK